MNEVVYKKIKDILIFVLGIGLILMLSKSCNQSAKINELKNLSESVSTELIKSRNNLNQEITKNQVIQTQTLETFIKLKSLDTTIIKLQNEVKENKQYLKQVGSSLTYFNNNTNYNGNIKTKVSLDSNKSPIYNFDLSDEWINLVGQSDSNNTHVDLKIKNQYSIIVGYDKVKEKGHWFKVRKPFTIVKNFNPYTETNELKTYQVSVPKPKKFGVGFSSGIGLNYMLQPYIYIGVGVNFNLFRF